MNHATVWLPEHVVLAIDLHERHFSAQVAADEFARLTGKPVTRNAMIGKWHRLGLRAGKEPVIRKVRAPERKKAVRMVPSPPLSLPTAAASRNRAEAVARPCDDHRAAHVRPVPLGDVRPAPVPGVLLRRSARVSRR